MTLALAAALSSGCVLFAPALRSPASGGAPWRALESEHFVLYTDVDRNDARKELVEFESLHHALEETGFPGDEVSEPRVGIVMFGRRADFEAIVGLGVEGMAYPQLALDIERQPTILFTGDLTEATRRVFVHEEAHELMHRAYGHTPVWLNEGLATYLSSLHVEGDRLVLGEVVPERMSLPVAAIPRPGEVVAMDPQHFYAATSRGLDRERAYEGAWLLVHLLRNGPDAYRARFQVLVGALNQGRTAQDGWAEAMKGLDPSQLARDFNAHVTAPVWRLIGRRIAPPPPVTVSERALRPAEVHLLWARLASSYDRALAARQVDQAGSLEPASGDVAYARGCIAMMGGNRAVAIDAFRAALATDPASPRYLFAFALVGSDCGRSGGPLADSALCEQLVAVARSPEQLAFAAQYLANIGRADEALRRASDAFRADGRCARCAVVLASILAGLGQEREAIAVLEEAASASPETPADRAIVRRLAELRRVRGASGGARDAE